MPLSSELPPPTSRAVNDVYDILHTLFFPSPQDHTEPILDSFVNTHDKVLGDDTVFSGRARIREAGVELDAVLRECRRLDEQRPGSPSQSNSEERISIDEVKRMRLRSRLHSQSQLPPSESHKKAEILKQVKDKRDQFDAEMKKAEEDALEEFKKGLRKAVVL
ncbi:hypothetical protein EX30DRAFT_371301 [Ascodesmis nigricans]|uniref:Uncharacterized protein n=1 Tax=Ascodesmis nigricans TaxID=341454 RepID=A0A4S2MY53_9PEZI|nr:hypothetical protein EX30DRAFT_371301 [Ascodesmis nigricans]